MSKNPKSILIAALGVLSIHLATAATPIEGKIVHVEDGDTVVLLKPDHSKMTIRVMGIDAPETCHQQHDASCRAKPGQPFGNVAQQSMAAKVKGKEAVVTCNGSPDKYGRAVCKIQVGNMDAGLELVREGLAWHEAKYLKDANYAVAFANAQRNRLGLWSADHPVRPSEWRDRCWKQGDCK